MTDLAVLKLYTSKNIEALEGVISAPKPQLEAFMLAAWAVKDDDIEILKMALEYCDPLQNDSMLLRQSVEFGSAKCFEMLLPISNPLAKRSEALQWAIYYDRVSMFNQLLKVCNIAEAMEEIDGGFDGVVFRRAQLIVEEQNAHKQALRIEESLATSLAVPKFKKI